ncbi:hypothetical protein P7C73_g4805, partial [Tremellales sp. Uapishka_1]
PATPAAFETPPRPRTPNKLRKKVHSPGEAPVPQLPPTPDPTPSPKKAWFKKKPVPEYKPRPPSPAGSNSSQQSWKHHESYFPEYTPLFPEAAWNKQPINPYATMVHLTPAEKQAQEHAASRDTRSSFITRIYPASRATIRSRARSRLGSRQSVEGWTGFGWAGEELPASGSAVFGAPMPIGIPPEIEGGKKKKKKKKKGGGGGGGGDEAGGDEDGGDGGHGGEGDDREEEEEGDASSADDDGPPEGVVGKEKRALWAAKRARNK